MKLFLNKAERIEYLGYDDLPWLLLFVPLLSGIVFLLFAAGRPEMLEQSLAVCIGLSVGYTTLYWVINRFWIIQLRKHYPHQNLTKKRVIIMVVFAIVTVITIKGMPVLTSAVLFGYAAVDPDQLAELPFDVMASIVLCLMVIAIYESIYFFKKYRDSLVEREILAKANMHAQLVALKQQVNPHFLFNSLNTLANVIPEDPQLAVKFVQRLSSVYRRVIDHRNREIITLEEELAALEDYVFLLKTRFEEKIEVAYGFQSSTIDALGSQEYTDHSSVALLELPPAIAKLKIPPLSLQLLVENAVKHNVVSAANPLRIHVLISADSLIITNPIRRRPVKQESTGLGHQNIRQRYRLLTERKVEIISTPTDFTVKLPLLQPEENVHYAIA